MGRSASCFKIITCGSDSVEDDDAIDNKRSGDKKGWSFRKRSEPHRVLSNTVIQEASSGLKESPESASYVQQSDVSIAPEKAPTVQYNEEKPQLPTPKECVEEKSQLVAPKEPVEENSQLLTAEDSKLYDPVVATTNEAKDDASMDDTVIIVIQTAIRGFLARKELGKLKNLVKLQAAVRGHLVRRRAVGTLRCVQAIVKMQLLVRARRAHLSQDGSYAAKKLDSKDDKDDQSLGNSEITNNASSTLIEKLLSNRFARQFGLELVGEVDVCVIIWKAPITKLPVEQAGKEKSDNFDAPLDAKVPSEAISESNEPKSVASKQLVSSGCEENLVTYDAANSKLEACQKTSSSVTGLEQSQIDIINTSDVKETLLVRTMQTDAYSQTEATRNRGKESCIGSIKVSNSAVIAALTKFSELSSTANSSRSVDSYCEDVGVSDLNTVSFGADTVIRSKEPSIAENPVSNRTGQHGGSECSTELSVTSNLDSPDRSEVGTIEYENGAKVSEQQNCMPGSFPSPKKLDDTKGESANLIVLDSPELEQEPTSNLLRGQDSEKVYQAFRSSPEASPRSHMTRKSLSAATGSPTATRDGDASSMAQSSRDQRSGKRRNSFGSTRPENIDEEPRDSNSSNSLPRFMQATESARAKVNANNSPRSCPDVQDRYIKKRHSLPGASGKQSSPRIQPSFSQAQQGAKTNGTNTLNEDGKREGLFAVTLYDGFGKE
ncbi:putative Zinc finger C-x8-C-x5-C-x3-H type family protein [Hibiscus syriacus]|uniref:Zinc finger C-x8-C-x5-C-x3-H type family protein n=1 Tax=Hibiscus syriacus TaxID=106335 RepID=A0A6A2YJ56_HIBSY|nr:putative Zinc finger C-x8-C-x5-C-x3-H type family protein [Hibiscus syriacus]